MNAEHSPPSPATSAAATGAKRDDAEMLHRFARDAIGVNRTFADLAPLLFRTRLLALNAEIASVRVGGTGASFGIVVKELLAMCAELRGIVADIEEIFADIAGCVGVWIRSRTQFDMYLRVVDALNTTNSGQSDGGEGKGNGEDASFPPVTGTPLLSGKIHALHERQQTAARKRPALGRTWPLALSMRERAVENIAAIEDGCARLIRLLQRVNYVATLQSGYLATTSRLEATNADQTDFDLSGVVGDIQQLAGDFSTLQADATDAVRKLSVAADRVMQTIDRD